MASSQTMYNRHKRVSNKLTGIYNDVVSFKMTCDALSRRKVEHWNSPDRKKLNQYYKGWDSGMDAVLWDKIWAKCEWMLFYNGRYWTKSQIDADQKNFDYSKVEEDMSCRVWAGSKYVFTIPKRWYRVHHCPMSKTNDVYLGRGPDHLTTDQIINDCVIGTIVDDYELIG